MRTGSLRTRLTTASAAMIALACASTGPTPPAPRSTDPAAIEGATWQWTGTTTPLERVTSDAPERYTLRLLPGGRAEILFDCNRGGGSYQISDGRLRFGPMMSTRMACPDDSMDARFMQDLERARTFFVEGDALFLEAPADGGTMRFRRAPGAAR